VRRSNGRVFRCVIDGDDLDLYSIGEDPITEGQHRIERAVDGGGFVVAGDQDTERDRSGAHNQTKTRDEVVSENPSRLPNLLHLLVDIPGHAFPVVAADTMNEAGAEVFRVVLCIVESGIITKHQPCADQ